MSSLTAVRPKGRLPDMSGGHGCGSGPKGRAREGGAKRRVAELPDMSGALTAVPAIKDRRGSDLGEGLFDVGDDI